jgi:hypothetical protein
MSQSESTFASMYIVPSPPPGQPGTRWRLADNLRDWLHDHGYEHDAAHGVWVRWEDVAQRCDVGEDHTWVFMMLRTADLLDAEAARLERDMRTTGAPLKLWAVLREGGPVVLREQGALDATALEEREFWSEDRVLFTIYAYTELHALYLLAVDFTQRPAPEQRPATAPLPPDYEVPITELLEYLAYDEGEDRWDIADATHRLAHMPLDRYRLVPSTVMTLNEEERHR